MHKQCNPISNTVYTKQIDETVRNSTIGIRLTGLCINQQYIKRVNDCSLTPNELFFSFITACPSYIQLYHSVPQLYTVPNLGQMRPCGSYDGPFLDPEGAEQGLCTRTSYSLQSGEQGLCIRTSYPLQRGEQGLFIRISYSLQRGEQCLCIRTSYSLQRGEQGLCIRISYSLQRGEQGLCIRTSYSLQRGGQGLCIRISYSLQRNQQDLCIRTSFSLQRGEQGIL